MTVVVHGIKTFVRFVGLAAILVAAILFFAAGVNAMLKMNYVYVAACLLAVCYVIRARKLLPAV